MNAFSDSLIDGGLPPHWTASQQLQFRNVFKFMYEHQDFAVHPDAEEIEPEHWKTIAWNFAVAAIDLDFAQERAVSQMVFVRTGPGPLEH